MTFQPCQVIGTLVAPDGEPLPDVQLQFLPAPVALRGTGAAALAPRPVAAVTGADARVDVALVPGVYTVRAREPEGREYPPFLIDVPGTGTAVLSDILFHLPAPQSIYDAAANARVATLAADGARNSADGAAAAAAAAKASIAGLGAVVAAAESSADAADGAALGAQSSAEAATGAAQQAVLGAANAEAARAAVQADAASATAASTSAQGSAQTAAQAAVQSQMGAAAAGQSADAAALSAAAAEATGRTYPSRAAFEAAQVPSTLDGWSVQDGPYRLRYRRDPLGTAIRSANGVKGSPEGAAYPEHWAENTQPGVTDMHAAGQAALDEGHLLHLLPRAYFLSQGWRIGHGNSGIIGAAPMSGSTIMLDPASTGDAVTLAHPNPDAFIDYIKLQNFRITGGANTARTGWAINACNPQGLFVDGVRWGGFYRGFRLAGGQLNSIGTIMANGPGEAHDVPDTAAFRMEHHPRADGSLIRAFTTSVRRITISGGPNAGIRDLIDIRMADNLQMGDVYAARAGRSMLRLGPSPFGNVRVEISNLYLDGVQNGAARYGIYVPDAASEGFIDLSVSNVDIHDCAEGFIWAKNDSLGRINIHNGVITAKSSALGLFEGPADGGQASLRLGNLTVQLADAGLAVRNVREFTLTGVQFRNVTGPCALLDGVVDHLHVDGLSLVGGTGAVDVGTAAVARRSPAIHTVGEGSGAFLRMLSGGEITRDNNLFMGSARIQDASVVTTTGWRLRSAVGGILDVGNNTLIEVDAGAGGEIVEIVGPSAIGWQEVRVMNFSDHPLTLRNSTTPVGLRLRGGTDQVLQKFDCAAFVWRAGRVWVQVGT